MKTIIFAILACGLAAPAFAQQTSTGSSPQIEPANSAKNWLIGRWEFDLEYTQSKLGENQRKADVADAGPTSVTSQLLDKMKGATLVVTDSEISMTRGDGAGKSNRYVVVTTPDPNVLQLRQENGEVMSFHREGDRISSKSSGSADQPFFFKKAQ
jgi:hypothetical protein